MRKIPNFPFFSLSFNACSENSGGAVHWHKLDWAFFSWKCDNRACEIFQIKHWNIWIKGNNNLFSEKGCYWKHTIRTPIQGLHCLPRYKDKDFKPRTQRSITKSNPERDFFSFMSVSDGLDTDHGWLSVGPDLGPNCLQMLIVGK